MKISIQKRSFELIFPFTITGYTFTQIDTIQVTVRENGTLGKGEAVGVYYMNETPDSMIAQINEIAIPDDLENINDWLVDALPSGGARNALDSATWDLKVKQQKTSIWNSLNIKVKPLTSVATIGISSPKEMADKALEYSKYKNLKIKLSNVDPIARLEAIRAIRPDASLIIDVNQGWTFDELKEYAPITKKLGIAMIEQPLPRGGDHELEGYKSPVPLGADESCLDSSEYKANSDRYDVINIKLDKCGGLTDALKIVELAKHDQKQLMVGNMSGSSLSMAPSYVIGQFCQFVDIDGPLFIKNDVDHAIEYGEGGVVSIPSPLLWG